MDPNQTQPQVSNQPQPTVPLAQEKQAPKVSVAGVVPGGATKPIQKIEKPKAPRGRGIGWLFGGMVNKDTLLMGVIVVLILMVLGMGAFVVGSMTNSGINVSFVTDETDTGTETSDTTTDENLTDSENGDTTTDSTPGQSTTSQELVYYLPAFIEDNPSLSSTDFPSGSSVFSYASENIAYLVPVRVLVEVAADQDLPASLAELFGQEDIVYKQVSLRNPFANSDIQVEVTTDFTGTLVAIQGDLSPSDQQEVELMQAMIQATIGNYVSDFSVTYNGTVDGFNTLGFVAGE